MAVIDGRMAKRARRSNKISADKYDFYTFPVTEARSKQPFRVAVRDFLSNHARVTFPPSTLFSSLMTWQILLSAEDPTNGSDLPARFITLDVVEEDVTKSSRSVYCDHCRVVGWSGHPVCRKRYHFIIRSRESKGVEIDLQKSCSRCGESTQLSPDCSSCGWCESALGADEATNWVYSQLDNQTHLLHGVIHYNGFAHLLSLNGIEGGSGFLTGGAIMDFWDRLCSTLGVNKVSVMDVSMKYGMDYRLLHAVTKGWSWYGEWGYEFKAGSYALTREAYQSAVETLSAMSVTEFLYKGRMQRTQLHSIVGFYQSYSCSQLVTLRDLFSFLLQLIDKNSSDKKLDKNSSDKKLASQRSGVECCWSSCDVERVQQAMIKILKAAGGVEANWITRWALKRSIYKTAASPVLLDYCLKHLEGVLADGESQVVNSRCNHITNDYEYRLEPVNSVSHVSKKDVNYPAVEHVKRDLKYLYDNLLHPQTMATLISQRRRNKMTDAATKILDCKHFIKDYLPTVVNPSAINLWCTAQLSDQNKEFPALPPELLVLPLNSTVGDLKTEAAKAFQEVYAMFKKFEVEDLLGYGYIDDSITLKFLVGQSGVVRIKGRCSTKHGYLRYRMERGLESWKVDCMCGANDDDGERMLACDVCSVWHHTRCAGIENSDALPSKFHCFRCIGVYSKNPKQSITKQGSSQMSQPGFVCRGESAAIGSGSNISVPLSVG